MFIKNCLCRVSFARCGRKRKYHSKITYINFESSSAFNIPHIYAYIFYNKTTCHKYNRKIESTTYKPIYFISAEPRNSYKLLIISFYQTEFLSVNFAFIEHLLKTYHKYKIEECVVEVDFYLYQMRIKSNYTMYKLIQNLQKDKLWFWQLKNVITNFKYKVE